MLRRLVPIIDWLPRYRRADLSGDLIAGVTVAAILIPQGMAYAQIAGLPAITGLYASTVPLLAYAILGRCRKLGVGPLATISIIAAVGLSKLANAGTARYIALAATLALMVGVIHIVLGVARLGFLVRFVSEPVMSGFLSAVGVLIIATQIGPLLGIPLGQHVGIAGSVGDLGTHVDGTSLLTLGIGVVCLALLLLGQRWRRFPMTLAVVAASAIVVAVFDLSAHGVAVVGSFPGGLPAPQVPPLGGHALSTLLPTALAVTLVGFVESMGLVRRYAVQDGDRVDANQELIALGASNAAAGLFQGMIVTGALTRSSVADDAGANTQLCQIVSAVLVAVMLLFFTRALEDVPQAALAAIVIVAVISFIKVKEARRLWRVKRTDFWMLVASFVATLTLGLEAGILIAVALSIVVVIFQVTRPHVAVLGLDPGTDGMHDVERFPEAETIPGVVIVRFDARLFFANAEYLQERLRDIEARAAGQVDTVVFDASGVDDLDATGDHVLRTIVERYHDRGVAFLMASVKEEVRDVMDTSGLTALIGEENLFDTDLEAYERVRQRR